jgi:hypothetical protein
MTETTVRDVVALVIKIANVVLANASLNPKSGGSSLTIGVAPAPAPVTINLSTTPTLAPGLHLTNNGTINFSANDYFTCGTCAVANNNLFILVNPDGNFSHFVDVTSGTFDNHLGEFELTGSLPGTFINFGTGVVQSGNYGKAYTWHLIQPSWVQQLTSQSVVQFAANFVAGLASPLTPGLAAATNLGDIGASVCANTGSDLGFVGGDLSACVTVDHTGAEAVVMSFSSSLAARSSISWNVTDALPNEKPWTFGIGLQATFVIDQNGFQHFELGDGSDQLAWCENVNVTFRIGFEGSHCWNPQDGMPYDLNQLPILLPGVHSIYLGVTTGLGLAFQFVASYSVTVSCGVWNGFNPLHVCPPASGYPPPSISGVPTVGQTLTASQGAWTTTPAITFQWHQCTSAQLTSCSSISGATGSQYVIQPGDRGKWIALQVKASNNGGYSTQPAGPVGAVT